MDLREAAARYVEAKGLVDQWRPIASGSTDHSVREESIRRVEKWKRAGLALSDSIAVEGEQAIRFGGVV